MSGVFKPCLEILPPAQQRLWPELGRAGELGFALYGGTALALRLGHRFSVDFDFFSEKPLDRDAIQAAFPFMAPSTVLQDERNTVSILVPYGDSERSHVKVAFFGTIDFGRVGDPDMTEDGVLQVASLDDLMATKVKVVLQRAEAKDYRDIVAMLNAGVSLPKGLAAARAMYGLNFQPSESLKAMVYFEDGDLRTLTTDEKNTLVKAVGAVRELPPVEIMSKQLTVSDRALSARIVAARQAGIDQREEGRTQALERAAQPAGGEGRPEAAQDVAREQQALLHAAPTEQAYQEALAVYVQAKYAQVARIEDRLESFIDRHQAKRQQTQANRPRLFSLPGTRRAWKNQGAQQQARLQTLHTRLEAVHKIKQGMGLHAPKLEELATRKLRAENPELAADWDALREAVRRQQLRTRKPEQGRKGTEQRERQGRGQTLGRNRPP